MIQNREAFLGHIANLLGRPVRTAPLPPPPPVNDYAQTRFADCSPDELLAMFERISTQVNLAQFMVKRREDVPGAVAEVARSFGEGDVVLSGVPQLGELGLSETGLGELLQRRVWRWNTLEGRRNAEEASHARTGIVWAEAGLAESGTMVLFSSPENGRSISLLPENTIFVLRRSALLPRLGMLARRLSERHAAGQPMPSCINLIGGPSSTADIELVKVVGVHGPLRAVYLVVDDL